MRSSLADLIRRVLMETRAADEAVHVDPAVINLTDASEEAAGSDGDRRQSDAVKSHRFVDTDRWRDAVRRTFSFLDGHKSVRDVLVKPVAVESKEIIASALPGSGMGTGRARIWVVDVEQGRRSLAALRASPHGFGERDITVVPIVGTRDHIVNPGPTFMPSAWMVAHTMFDNLDSEDLPQCREVQRALSRQVGSKRSFPLLYNCGWAENALKMASEHFRQAAVSRQGGEAQHVAVPPIGKRLTGGVRTTYEPPREGQSEASSYFLRPPSDYVAEAMTIAATKPEGFRPRLDLIHQIPSALLHDDYRLYNRRYYREVLMSDERSASTQLTAEEIAGIHWHITEDLRVVEGLVSDVRERLAADLLGKVIFVAVH